MNRRVRSSARVGSGRIQARIRLGGRPNGPIRRRRRLSLALITLRVRGSFSRTGADEPVGRARVIRAVRP